jgi:hypothetical protein
MKTKDLHHNKSTIVIELLDELKKDKLKVEQWADKSLFKIEIGIPGECSCP